MSTPSIAPPEPLQLYLLRHADAGDPMAWPGDDAKRPLSAKGKRQARRLGSMLADIGWRPDVILASPKLRASQTARIVGEAVDVKPADEGRLASALELSDLEGMLAAHPDARRVVLVGHDPDFSSIASTLIGAPIELRKGALARIDLSDAGATAGEGSLRWLIPPGAVPD
jgi:phosphohistidine phosphatase